jgi:predicted RNA binding protein YcfA (HicA-like mRNA interferase family)
MTYSELTRKLRRLGCYPTRFGAGSHELWRNPATQTPIPYHSAKDIGAGLLAPSLRQLGIERDKFDEA